MDTLVTICYGVMIGLLVGMVVFHSNQFTGLINLIRAIRDRQDDDIDLLCARVAVLEESLNQPKEAEA